MKKLFIVLCDIMFIAASLAVGIFLAWIVMTVLGRPVSGALKAVCAVAAIVAVIATAASFIVWKHGGAPGGDDPPTEEGIK